MSDWGVCPSCRVGRLVLTSRGTLACTAIYDLSHPGPGGVMIHGGLRCGYEAMPPIVSAPTTPPVTQRYAAPRRDARRVVPRSPSRGLLYRQLVEVIASPLSGLARTLNGPRRRAQWCSGEEGVRRDPVRRLACGHAGHGARSGPGHCCGGKSRGERGHCWRAGHASEQGRGLNPPGRNWNAGLD
jgi:hypothetical protein